MICETNDSKLFFHRKLPNGNGNSQGLTGIKYSKVAQFWDGIHIYQQLEGYFSCLFAVTIPQIDFISFKLITKRGVS